MSEPLDGVGRTAVGVARVRAHETARPDRLFHDPYAAAFVAALPAEPQLRLSDEQRSVGAAFAAHAILRTRFYDDYLLAARTSQVVLLAAGLDARAFRLAWPPGVHLFEVDLPDVLAVKQSVLDARSAAPHCLRTTIPADLRDDWTDRLVAAGFDPARPTAWLAEGLLIYLTHEAADRLLTDVTELSAPGSQVAFEYTTGATADLLDRSRTSGAMAGYSALWQGGLTVDATDWLREHGWRPTVFPLTDLAAGYGRPLRRPAASSLLSAVRDG
jgi:methyltransferase (TIGR00027 family)